MLGSLVTCRHASRDMQAGLRLTSCFMPASTCAWMPASNVMLAIKNMSVGVANDMFVGVCLWHGGMGAKRCWR
jgi:hypothetical protein